MEQNKVNLIVSSEDLELKRLDKYLAKNLPDFSRNFIKKLFEDGHITSEAKLELKKLPAIGTMIEVVIPEPKHSEAQPENIPIEILFEDEYLMIINKAAGMVVHPAPGNETGTLVNAILFHCKDLKGVGNVARPGIVHRLDKGTSGVMVVAKEQKTHEKLVEMFSKHNLERRYQAICLGTKIEPKGKIESNIGRNPQNRLKMKANVKNGKNAVTHFEVKELFHQSCHIELKLETGRTHQIRVHLSQLMNRPILNDELYGLLHEESKRINSSIYKIYKEYPHPFLHAKLLAFKHPITEEDLRFETEPPQMFQDVLGALRNE
jgi:23S rRNA pseudouridine1911/1915/1917 synthase